MSKEQTPMKDRHATARRLLPKVRHVIGEQEVKDAPQGYWSHIDPSTGDIQAEIPMAGAREVDAAVSAARKAFPAWRDMPPGERRDILLRLAQLVKTHTEELTTLSVLENGMSCAVTGHTLGLTYEWFSYYAGWVDKIAGEVTSYHGDDFCYTLPEPYGVIAAIITWNGPVMSMGMKIAPALAAGNTVVYKPAEITPFTAQRVLELAWEAGIPPGVLNIVHGGAEAGAALTSHPGVDKISFTGGPLTAHRILEAAAKTLKPSVLELGGKSANLVFADANLAEAVPVSLMMCMVNAGQGCSLPTRLLVEDSIYDGVVEQLVAIAKTLSVGDPLLPASFLGPVVNEAAGQRILSVIERAQVAKSGKLVAGGKRLGGEYAGGAFIEPTIFIDVDPASELAQKEVFGPVLAVSRFKSEDEAVTLANNTDYGLAAYIQTGDQRRVKRLAPKLRAGSICVNGAIAPICHLPFGGLGISGYGKEGGKAGIDEFLHHKAVIVR